MLVLQNVYLKDCSYEAPHGPRLEGNWNPQINLDLQTGSAAVNAEVREVVLTVTVSAKQNDATIFLVEVKQAGTFVMRNLPEERPEARHQHGVPRGAVPVRARGGLAAGVAGRISAVSAAAGELRCAVRRATRRSPPPPTDAPRREQP